MVGKGKPPDIDYKRLRQFLPVAFEAGIQRVSLTGGEPLLTSAPADLLIEFAGLYPDRQWVLQTNGFHLRRYLPQLSAIKNLILKVSLDVFDRIAFRRLCGVDALNEVVAAIRQAREFGIQVGINVVLTRDSLPHVRNIIGFAREMGCYVKFMDLNWYADVGARAMSSLVNDAYWNEQYVSPLSVLLPAFYAAGIRSLRFTHNHTYGIPVMESLPDGEFFIRIKDSAVGTTYAPVCLNCRHFASRKCQEGIYELTLTPDFRLKICRHRPDLEDCVDLTTHSESDIADTLLKVFRDIYEPSEFYEIPQGFANPYHQ